MNVIGLKIPPELESLYTLRKVNSLLFDDVINDIITLVNSQINECSYDGFTVECSDFEESIIYKLSTFKNSEQLRIKLAVEPYFIKNLYTNIMTFMQECFYNYNLTGEYKFHYIDSKLLVIKKIEERSKNEI